MTASFATVGIYTPDALIAGNAHLLVARKVTLSSGQNLPRGAVIGKTTDTGEYVLSTAAATDGSQVPDLILAEAGNATGGDIELLAYERGDFLTCALTLGQGHTVASIKEGLRAKGITLLPAMV
ncbi:MAG: head decoration protein [Burkholderiaceae bacterium]|nr:head decoration protein [Burkholderiaceae bacterium]